VKHAINVPPFGAFGDVHALVALAVSAEENGWDGFFVWDHVLYSEDVPFVDAWTALAAIASTTSTIRLGPGVAALARRRPWRVARESVTLDHLSNGRLILGVGLGTDFWRDFSAFSGEADDDIERAELTDDAIEIITRLWTGERVSYEGKRLSITDARFLPRPVQQPRIPIWTGVIWKPWTTGPLRRSARCDGVMPFRPTPFTVDEAREIRDTFAAARGNDDFDLCLPVGQGRMADFEAAGVTWCTHNFAPPEGPLERVQKAIASGPPD
jgi:alkanesulfonate monooxygenase SsuD/methylene tetrahydromethanopterin reductase-like flavin-dependent oxidoreductase (luciferase family)